MSLRATGACTHRCTHLGFVHFHEILDIFKDKVILHFVIVLYIVVVEVIKTLFNF